MRAVKGNFSFTSFLLVLGILLYWISLPLFSAIPPQERAALVALYNSTTGDNWSNNSGWKTPPLDVDGFARPGTENTWYGITCDPGNTTVQTIQMGHNNLDGTIPPELVNLVNLDRLFLNSNQLSGIIPSNLTNLTNLISNFLDLRWNALYTNDDTLRIFLNSKQYTGNWESTQTIAPTNVSASALSSSSIRVYWNPIPYTADTGGYKVYYSTFSGGPYTYSGMTADKSVSSYDVTGLSPRTTYYLLVKTQTNPHYYNDNTVVSEYSEEVPAATGPPEKKDPPFGSFDTPIDGSTVASSIPITGWALDDSGIDSVKIYRAQGNSLVYIGDAVLVEGARPDVAAAYPGYPNNTKAGWGCMMLTNLLPNSGNGTFVIHAIATDLVGKTTTLGTKTIHCDNANAVKPFGAIDTPTQVGTASGSSFVNWGWVLTPQPNSIPTDGSTINVWVDGVDLGNPTYNIYRSDIASLFPGCNNSDGAAGYFYLDTTAYENGVHTIQWTAANDAGNSDGIGSRYFTIQNTGRAASHKRSAAFNLQRLSFNLDHVDLTQIPVDYYDPIEIIEGHKQDTTPQEIYPDDSGIINVKIRELERVEIHLEGTMGLATLSDYAGCLVAGNQLKRLPIGSTLDTNRGIFYWQPGPGFIGEYRFIFIEKGHKGEMYRKNIMVKILPGVE